MKTSVVITEKEFKNKFDNVLLDNPTIHKILSKESNLGFTTQLVLDQLKAELTESIFSKNVLIAEEDTGEITGVKETFLTTTESSETRELATAEEDSTEEQSEDGIDDLDELD